MKESILKTELLKVYQIYVEGFKTNDMKLIDSVVKYPMAFLKDGNVEMRNEYPINPEKLKKEKKWHHSTDWKFEITAINETHAHMIASAIRRRADDSIIEKASGFYGFSKINKEWKIYAFSELVN